MCTSDDQLVQFRELIERSSLGSPEAKQFREQTPRHVRAVILRSVVPDIRNIPLRLLIDNLPEGEPPDPQ